METMYKALWVGPKDEEDDDDLFDKIDNILESQG